MFTYSAERLDGCGSWIAGLAGAVAAAVGKVDPFVDPKFALTGEL